MWKSNVACLRSYSSAVVQHGCGLCRRHEPFGRVRVAFGRPFKPSRRLRHTKHGLMHGEGAIGQDEFFRALREVLPWVGSRSQPHMLGIAVSGGVDSMALATLYAKCEHVQLPTLQGFIVDHKARPGSTEEARWVADQLSKLGVQSTIIPLSWPEGFDPKHITRFETEARRLRYQALGKACRDKGIKSLLVAHHADDQAETIMMRLLHARLRSGLQGMKSVEWIPECYGIHGVYHSGTPPPKGDSTLPLVEHGGLNILRPLMGFDKSSLIATCEKHNTRWAEDKTNQDKTLTLRNAVRHLLKNHRLPKALSKESMWDLAQTTQSRVEKHQAAAEALFNSCHLRLDIKTGSLVVRLPPVEALFAAATSDPSSLDKLQARNTAHFLLERVADLVSPMEKSTKESLANAVLFVYPSLAPDSFKVTERKSFTCYNCWWNKSSVSSAFKCSAADPPVDQLNEWMLTRAPPPREEVESLSITFPPGEKSDSGNVDLVLSQRADWHLFDGRFWVRVHNKNDREVVLKTLADQQLKKLLEINPNSKSPGDHSDPEMVLHDRRKHIIRAALSATKPHALRRHLPALFLAPPPTNPDAEPTLIAFPTLQSSDKVSRRAAEQLKCTWDVKYKKIDPGRRALFEILEKRPRHRVDSDLLVGERKAMKTRLIQI